MSRGPQWRNLRPCGTDAAWRRHHRHDEPKDDACRQAHNAARQVQRVRAARRAGKGRMPA
jgi:hypothetical protein